MRGQNHGFLEVFLFWETPFNGTPRTKCNLPQPLAVLLFGSSVAMFCFLSYGPGQAHMKGNPYCFENNNGFLSYTPSQAHVRAQLGLDDRKSLFFKSIGILLYMGLARPGRLAGQLDAKLYVYPTQIASPTLRAQQAGLGQAHPGPPLSLSVCSPMPVEFERLQPHTG